MISIFTRPKMKILSFSILSQKGKYTFIALVLLQLENFKLSTDGWSYKTFFINIFKLKFVTFKKHIFGKVKIHFMLLFSILISLECVDRCIVSLLYQYCISCLKLSFWRHLLTILFCFSLLLSLCQLFLYKNELRMFFTYGNLTFEPGLNLHSRTV
jgi:hypothetical protein